jgi:hypothetical protein
VQLKKVAAEEPFVLTAMASFLTALVWLTLRPQLLTQFFYSPETLALTHLVTLGFASSIVQGVTQRLAPRTFGIAPPPRWRALLQCALYLIATSGLVVHFLLFHWVGLAWSAGLLVVAAALLAWNFRAIVQRAFARGPADWPARWVAASLGWFLVAALLGASFGVLKGYGVGGTLLGAPLLDRLASHLHVGLLGWIGGAIFGYQWKLLPATRSSNAMEAWRFGLYQLGLAAMANAYLAGAESLARWCALPIVAAIALRSVPAIVRRGGNRAGFWETVAHGLLLLLAATGLALAFEWLPRDPERRPALQFAYAYVALFGWILLTVMGTSWKLFSVWIWEERFLPERAIRPIPAVSQLPSPLLRDLGGSALTLGVLGVASGILLDSLPAIRVALAVELLGAACFVAQFVRLARWELLKLEYRPPARVG